MRLADTRPQNSDFVFPSLESLHVFCTSLTVCLNIQLFCIRSFRTFPRSYRTCTFANGDATYAMYIWNDVILLLFISCGPFMSHDLHIQVFTKSTTTQVRVASRNSMDAQLPSTTESCSCREPTRRIPSSVLKCPPKLFHRSIWRNITRRLIRHSIEVSCFKKAKTIQT